MITEESIRKAANELADLLIRKNQDYGNSVQEQYEEYGLVSILIRLDDKMRRLKNLQNNEALVNEPKKETIQDLAGYSLLGFILLSEDVFENEPLRRNLKAALKEMQSAPKYFDQDDQ